VARGRWGWLFAFHFIPSLTKSMWPAEILAFGHLSGELPLSGVQPISLAEFSRAYLRALDYRLCELPGDTASLRLPENSFAAQVVLGMSKTCRTNLSEDSPEELAAI